MRVEIVDIKTDDEIGWVELADDGTVTADEHGREMLNTGPFWKLDEAEAVRQLAQGWSNAYSKTRVRQ